MVRIAFATLALAALPAQAQMFEDETPQQAYEDSCAVCHGLDARGEGPVTQWLIKTPPDLTTLAAGNEGYFPDDYVYYVIDGRAEVATHGPREMPVWGRRFGSRTGPAGESEEKVQERILKIIEYLKTLQR